MSKRVIILTFEQESVSYQAFSEIKRLHNQREVRGEQMAVISHKEDGSHQFEMQDFIDFTGADHSAKNSTIGMLIGLLAGPLGMMLGWFAGGMIGGAKDAKEITTATSIFEHVGKDIAEGETGVVLIADEDDNRPLNQLIFNKLGGNITRLELEDVEEEITDAKELEQDMAEHAVKTWQEKREEKQADEH
ncbi:DUF1269 domain-containing protein [Vagococcus humatus]|uniref:DUF1269 domain-containing protein n=1 Tax=Vagococcus humatus TaxID=1889241 RepID=A0A3S0ADA4_9ENTE|nr:DUF1269 domain-containing protein [Vagococcus humatus]RST90085.1 DUF1269 domain-containing protein [Vagococcus humatus]